jgi:hypothetical protein
VSTDCASTTSLPVGETCTLSIDFAPVTVSGTRTSIALSEAVKATTNTLNASGTVQKVTVTGTETKKPQTVTFPAVATQAAATKLALTATATSGLAPGFSSSTPAVCTAAASGSTASLIAAGTRTTQASQAGNDVYSAAKAVPQTFTVNHANQTVTFPTIASQAAATTLKLTATASSGHAQSINAFGSFHVQSATVLDSDPYPCLTEDNGAVVNNCAGPCDPVRLRGIGMAEQLPASR